MKIPRDLPQPMFIRPNDYISLRGTDYIVKRNEFGQMIKVIGRVARKLPSTKDIIWALRSHRPVAYWGNKYFMFERIDEEVVPEIMEAIWEADRRRGVQKPDMSDIEEKFYEF